MWKFLKRQFIPHLGNEFRPHLLRGRSVFVLTLAVVVLFGFQALYFGVMVGSNFFAAVVPGVIADLTNSDRAEFHAPPLSVNALLTEAAKRKAEDMAAKGYFAHTSPEGKTPWYWFSQVGYVFSYAGENLAVHFSDSQDVEAAWLNSPGHRANILNKNFTEIGIATAEGVYQGVATTFVVEAFGRPLAPAAPILSPYPSPTDRVLLPPSASESRLVSQDPKPSVSMKPIPPSPQPAARGTRGDSVAPDIELVSSDGMFVAIRNVEPTGIESPSVPRDPDPPRATFAVRKVLTSGRSTVYVLYALLAALIAIPLLLAIIIEVEKQHPRHIVYAVFLLLLISTAVYTSHVYLAPQLLIV